MRTAKEMYEFSVKNKYGTGTVKSATKKHFGVVAEQLQSDERALISFAGLHEQEGSGLQGAFAYAITNKRLIMGQKGVMGRSKTKTVLIEHLNDITVRNSMTWRNIEIDTIKDHFLVRNNSNTSKELGPRIQEAIFKLKEKKPITHVTQEVPVGLDAIEQIRGYQQLMNEGILTEDEFEEKKKQLLNL